MLCSDLSTVRQFLLKQTQLKCVMFGIKETKQDTRHRMRMTFTEHVIEQHTKDVIEQHTKDVIDTVKVLKCYSGIAN